MIEVRMRADIVLRVPCDNEAAARHAVRNVTAAWDNVPGAVDTRIDRPVITSTTRWSYPNGQLPEPPAEES